MNQFESIIIVTIFFSSCDLIYIWHNFNIFCLYFSVPYSALSSTLLLIEETSARLEIIRILSNFFRSVLSLSPNDLVHCVYLCVNKVAPDYDGIELGIGETIILKAIADSTGRTVEQLKLDYKSKGDLGLVAEVIEKNEENFINKLHFS